MLVLVNFCLKFNAYEDVKICTVISYGLNPNLINHHLKSDSCHTYDCQTKLVGEVIKKGSNSCKNESLILSLT